MALHHAVSGDVIDLNLSNQALADAPSTALFKSTEIEVIRMVLKAGKQVPEHSTPGEITLLCLEGVAELRLRDGVRTLHPGHIICLDGNVPHALHAVDNALLLLTIVLKHTDTN